MTRHHHHHVARHHAHVSPHHHHTHRHHPHHQTIGDASKKAYRTIGKDIVKPFWHDVVKPVTAIPSQALHTVDNTVDDVTGLLKNPFFLIAGGLLAVKVLTK